MLKVIKDIDTSKSGLFFSTLERTNPSVGKPLAALASLAKGTTDILGKTIGGGLETLTEMNIEGGSLGIAKGLPLYIAKRLAAQKAGVTLEEYDETNPYNVFEVKTLSNAIDKATVKYIDKNTGKH